MSVITVSRQSGSEGNKIVRIVCNQLGCKYFDKHLMAQLAEEMGMNPTEVEDITASEHHISSFWEKAFSRISISPVAASWVLTNPYETKEEINVNQVSGFILAAYRQGDVVIVGRGSQVILRDKPDVLHVRIVAPLKRRIERWMEREHLSYDDAEKIAKERDHKHIHFVKTYFYEDIDNPDLYDLIINTEKLPLDKAADLIIDAASSI